jgi:predicted nucleotidyltransferase component of viral defense system
MMTIKQEDILHKAQLLRLLAEIVDDPELSASVYFKGGTCASMLGYLDRFSFDLDFDLKAGADRDRLRLKFRKLFEKLSFEIENENKKALLFVLKYAAPKSQRSTLKLSIFDLFIKANVYKPAFLPEIDRLVNCQTIETMFANKLVAPLDRFRKHEKIAGRDIYDIHYFFSQGYSFRKEIVEERTKTDLKSYIKILIEFIEERVTEKTLNEDLNMLLPFEKFQKIRKTLKAETLIFLRSAV